MKMLNTVLMSAVVVATFASAAPAHAHNRDVAFRYKTTYSEFDRGFYDTYGYREQRCANDGWGNYTCFDRTRVAHESSYIWIEEEWYHDGYKRVVVYDRDPQVYFGNPYASYYVYDYGGYRRVERRELYYGPTYTYYDDWYYRDHYTVWVELDWNDPWTNLVVGAYTALVGVDILAHAHDNVDVAVGVASLGLAASSSWSAHEHAKRNSDLQKQIAKNKQGSDRDGNNVR